ncbi:hypothetical protein H8A99_43975 [Bradyrhizobium sp. Arg68]|nr:hypothetical protein [Bradyrhizobium ivorense]
MRVALALGVVAMLWCAAADAATVHHRRVHHHVIVRPSEPVAAPAWYGFPGYKPIPPEENRNLDPSNFGSG